MDVNGDMNVKPTSSSRTLHDVSRHLGVSTATVSRVLNGSDKVRQDTRDRVLRAIHDLGYTRNYAARALARQRTDTLGVIFPNIDSGFFSEVLKGIHEVASLADFHLMVAFSRSTTDEPDLVGEYLQGGRVDGLILMNLDMPEGFVRDTTRQRLPIVLVDRPVSGAEVATVSLDNIAGACDAVSHLLGHGYRRIAVIKGPDGTFDSEQRWIGCQRAFAQAGMAVDPELVWDGDFHKRSGYERVKMWLSAGKALPDAIFALNDAMAIGAMEALREFGLSAPQDVAIVGFDDIEAAPLLGLSTVRSPMREMGREAARALIELLRSGETRTNRVLTTCFVARGTCGRHETADP